MTLTQPANRDVQTPQTLRFQRTGMNKLQTEYIRLTRPDWKMPKTQLTTPIESQIGIAQPPEKKPGNKRHPSVSDTQTAKIAEKKPKQNKPPLLQTNIDVRKMQAQVLEESRQTLGGFITAKPQKVQFVKKIKRQNSLSRTGSHGPHRSDLLKEIYIDSSLASPRHRA